MAPSLGVRTAAIQLFGDSAGHAKGCGDLLPILSTAAPSTLPQLACSTAHASGLAAWQQRPRGSRRSEPHDGRKPERSPEVRGGPSAFP